MSPKTTEDTPLQKTEKEKRRTEALLKDLKKRKIYFVTNWKLLEELKESLKKQEPGKVGRKNEFLA